MTARVWAVPALLALGTSIGLVAALTGDGWPDWISWAGLGAPVLVTFRAIRARS